MNPVTAGSAADSHDQVARAGGLGRQADRDRGHVAAEYQGVAQEAVVEADGPVDGGDAHPVAVVTDTGDHSSHHAAWM